MLVSQLAMVISSLNLLTGLLLTGKYKPSDLSCFTDPDPKAICGVETLRKVLDVSCRVAIAVAVVIGKNWPLLSSMYESRLLTEYTSQFTDGI